MLSRDKCRPARKIAYLCHEPIGLGFTASTANELVSSISRYVELSGDGRIVDSPENVGSWFWVEREDVQAYIGCELSDDPHPYAGRCYGALCVEVQPEERVLWLLASYCLGLVVDLESGASAPSVAQIPINDLKDNLHKWGFDDGSRISLLTETPCRYTEDIRATVADATSATVEQILVEEGTFHNPLRFDAWGESDIVQIETAWLWMVNTHGLEGIFEAS